MGPESSSSWSWLASLMATIFFLRSLLSDFLPPSLAHYLKTTLYNLPFLPFFPRETTITVEEFDFHGYSDTFHAALRYLSCRSPAAPVRATDTTNSRGYSFAIDDNHTLYDHFLGVKLRWSFQVHESIALGRGGTNRVRYLELAYPININKEVREVYFPMVLRVGMEQENLERKTKLYTNSSSGERGSLWSSVEFDHPSTFDTLAVDPELKKMLVEDLKAFVSKEDYYKRVGRTWKRGYLIYGPPGTGKTSLVAAMANFLDFDVYDLELAAVTSNSQLRRLLLETRRRSLIVIEDIDRSIPLPDFPTQVDPDADELSDVTCRRHDLSLSGMLNFMDGLWSCCGQERLMVVTTNHKAKLDSALLRPGRLDVHVNFSFCGVPALRTLVRNYLNTSPDEAEWSEVEEMIGEVEVTPAVVAEVLIGSGSPEVARIRLLELFVGLKANST